MRAGLLLACLGCADVTGPVPRPTLFLGPDGEYVPPSNPNAPHCDPPLGVWWVYWMTEDGPHASWFCALPPDW